VRGLLSLSLSLSLLVPRSRPRQEVAHLFAILDRVMLVPLNHASPPALRRTEVVHHVEGNVVTVTSIVTALLLNITELQNYRILNKNTDSF
jgi:hypothetical protein